MVFILATVSCETVLFLASSVCPLVDEADGRDWHWEKLGLALVGRVMLSNTLIC